jgi:Flp pilus assembly protein TadD
MGGAQEACANLAVLLVRAGRFSEARDAAGHASALPATSWGQYNLGCYSALAGDRARSLSSLRRAVDLGFADALIASDPDLATMRGDHRFAAVAAEVERRLERRREQTDSVFPWQG